MTYHGTHSNHAGTARNQATVQSQDIGQIQEQLVTYCVNQCPKYDVCHSTEIGSCSRMESIAQAGAMKIDSLPLDSIVE